MSSETLYLTRHIAHRDRHTPHLCPNCGAPLTAEERCTTCAHTPPERRVAGLPDARTRLERMERAAGR